MLNVVEKAPEEPMTACCVTPSSVTATYSPWGVCTPLARVPAKVVLAVPTETLWATIPENVSESRFRRLKMAGVAAPTSEAVTVYKPTMELAVAVTWATPLEPMIAVAAERLAEAPFWAGLAVKLTTPPATRLDGIDRGDGDGQRIGERGADDRALGSAAGHHCEDEPLTLEGADVGDGCQGLAALVGGDAGNRGAGCAGRRCQEARAWSGWDRRSCPAGPDPGC